jgi:hypothetical protein
MDAQFPPYSGHWIMMRSSDDPKQDFAIRLCLENAVHRYILLIINLTINLNCPGIYKST